jgi:hypothetical protein
MRNNKIKSSNLIYASEDEEFFWEKDDSVVEEGIAVGYEVEREETLFDAHTIDLVLFEDIYHEFKEEIF